MAPHRQTLIDFDKASRSSQGKSLEHQMMQDAILANPRSVGTKLKGEIIGNECESEYLFWSKDRLDVVIKTTEEWVGFEVKPLSASHNELRKGIYQAVKYEALLRADLLDQAEVKACRCVFVTQGQLPAELITLAQTLRVEVIQDYAI